MPAVTDAVWVDVLPNMSKFGPVMAKGAGAQGAAAGKVAGMSFGKAATLGVAAVATGAALATTALFKIGSTFQDVENTIRVGTGATGDALERLTDSAKTVGTRVPASFEDIGTAIADLNTRLGLTGEPLENMAEQFLELSRITGTDLAGNIANITRVFGDWDIATEDQSETMDRLFRASQASGVGVDTLSQQVVQFGAPLRQLGFGFEESIALLAGFEKEGVNTSQVMAGMRQSLGRMAKAGEEPADAFARITDEIANAGTQGEANAIAMELFGTRAGPDMAAAIREGRLELGDMLDQIENGSDTIMDAGADTMNFSEQWQIFKNKVMVDLAPLAKRVFDTITTGMTWIQTNGIPTIRTFGEWVQRNAAWLAPLAAAVGTMVTAIAAWTVATKALVAVKAVLAAVTAGTLGPIFLVVAGIAALVAALVTAYKTSETFRNIVQKVWEVIRNAIGAVVSWFTGTAWPAIRKVYDGIAAAAKWLWEKAIKPAWEGIRLAVAVAVEAIRLLWRNVLKPAWDAVAKAAQWLWRNVLSPTFRFVGDAWRALVDRVQQGWRRVMKPAWDAVSAGAKFMWERVLRPVFRFIGDRWDELARGMQRVYNSVLKPVFDGVGRAVGTMREAVRGAVDAIRRAWDGLKRAFAAPVNWVINNVINKFLGWVNRIAKEIGVSIRLRLVPTVPSGQARPRAQNAPLGRNRGGIIPGMGPDRDSVLTALTPGEYVWSRTAVRNVGAGQLDAMHEAALRGEPIEMGDGPGWLRRIATSALNWARKFIVNTVRPGFDTALSLMDATVGKWGVPGQMAAGTSRKLGNSLLDWVAGIEDEADRRTPELGPGIGWEAMWAAVKGAFPWARFTSGYRPGAITATGNPSWHGKGRAIDVAGRTPMNHPDMLTIARWIRDNYAAKTLELIYSRGPSLINGKPWTPTGITRRNHFDHVHWAMDNGGWLMPGVSQVANWTGKPEAVLTDRQWRTLRDAAIRNQSGGDSYEFHGVREDVIVAKLERRDRMRQVTR